MKQALVDMEAMFRLMDAKPSALAVRPDPPPEARKLLPPLGAVRMMGRGKMTRDARDTKLAYTMHVLL